MIDPRGYQRFLRSVHQIRRLFAVGIAVMVVCWSMVLPATLLWGRYTEAQSRAQARVDLAAEQVSSYIAAHLETWEFQALRLPSLIETALLIEMDEIVWLSLSDGAGNDIVTHGRRDGEWPVMLVQREVSDGRQPVGRLAVQMRLIPVLAPALAWSVAGIVLSLLLLGLARLLARRALDGALERVEAVTGRLRDQVEELERTRAELATQLAAREADQALLARHADNLAMASQDLTHVAQLAAHHLQEPLRTVLAFSQLLVNRSLGQGDADPVECVSFIRSGVRRMQAQLSALSGYLALRDSDEEAQPLALAEVLADLRPQLAPQLEAAGAVLEWGELPVVMASRHHMLTLFHDVICAALRYAAVGTALRVEVTAGRLGPVWRIAVADNGLPLDSRDPDRMFHLLVHGEDGAMGVGLAPCRRIVHLLGGDIVADRRPGGGVVVSFTLPPA